MRKRYVVEVNNKKYVVFVGQFDVIITDEHGNELFDMVKSDVELLYKIWREVRAQKIFEKWLK